jgi:hypothetical protein
MTRLAIFATHPIQYFAPLWRELAHRKGLDITVYYFSDHSVRGRVDTDFNTKVAWDVPLLKGYRHVFLSHDADLSRPSQVNIENAKKLLTEGNFDAVLIQGYTHRFERQVLKAARALRIKVIMRADFSLLSGIPWWKRLIKKFYLRWFYRQVDAFGVVGENARKHLVKYCVSEDRMFYSPWAIDTKYFEKQKCCETPARLCRE